MNAVLPTLFALAALSAAGAAATTARDAAEEMPGTEVPERGSAATGPASTIIVTAKRLQAELETEAPVAPDFDALLEIALDFEPPGTR